MNIHLAPELEKLVHSQVSSGRYQSASEVVTEALRLLQQRDELFGQRAAEIRGRIEEGWEAAQLGRLTDGDEVFDRIEAELLAIEHSAGK